MNPIDIYVIDKCRIFREGLKRLLPEQEFALRGEADTVDQAVAGWGGAPSGSGIVLTEYPDEEPGALAQLNGADDHRAASKVVVLAPRMDCEWLRNALAQGAAGFLLRDTSAEALLASLRLVVAGEKVLPTGLAPYLVAGQLSERDPLPAAEGLEKLSARERHVLQALVQGHSNKLIARNLRIAEGTVKVHLKGVLKKLNLRNRTQAAVWALNSGLTQQVLADRVH